MRFSSVLVTSLSLVAFTSAGSGVYDGSLNKRFRKRTPEGVDVDVFEHAATNSSLEYVTNSGICETTPGVNQYSGYLNVGTNMSMFFWFFEARHNPDTAPLSVWINGGPGCSSMIGLFQENGPCRFTNITQSEPVLNPYSWNEYANMLYIDQPIGTGFSVGAYSVNSTVTAAPYVWKFMQAFFTNFPRYKTREFGLFTESYGGHYGPAFADYFLTQNDKIDEGCVEGERIDMIALGINNGWIDPANQYKSYATYALTNPYKQLLDNASYAQVLAGYEKYCVPAVAKCTATTGDDDACATADYVCKTQTMTNLQVLSKENFNVYDVRIGADVQSPPAVYIDYITTESVRKKIGVRSRFHECDNTVYLNMNSTGDDARSFLGVLEGVVHRNISTLIWAGDADWICNWEGNFNAVNALKWYGQDEFANKTVEPYTVDGQLHGEYKSVDNLSWLKVYEAGHEVPYYQPEVSLQAFIQIMKRKPLSPT